VLFQTHQQLEPKFAYTLLASQSLYQTAAQEPLVAVSNGP
jgi:hypothetical protein